MKIRDLEEDLVIRIIRFEGTDRPAAVCQFVAALKE